MSTTFDVIIPPRFQVESTEEYVNYLASPPGLSGMIPSVLASICRIGIGISMCALTLLTAANSSFIIVYVSAAVIVGSGFWKMRALLSQAGSGLISFTITKSMLIVRLSGWLGERSLTWHRDEIQTVSSAARNDFDRYHMLDPRSNLSRLNERLVWIVTRSGERTPIGEGYFLRIEETKWLAGALRRSLELAESRPSLDLP